MEKLDYFLTVAKRHASLVSKAETKSEIEEELCLFYVAMTLARKKLYLLNYSTHPYSKEKVSRVKESIFIPETKRTGYGRTLKDQELDDKRQSQISQVMSDFAEGDQRHFVSVMQVNHNTRCYFSTLFSAIHQDINQRLLCPAKF